MTIVANYGLSSIPWWCYLIGFLFLFGFVKNRLNQTIHKYVLNGSTSYDETLQYGLYNGVYTFTNIPDNHPIAILNNNKECTVIIHINWNGFSSLPSWLCS